MYASQYVAKSAWRVVAALQVSIGCTGSQRAARPPPRAALRSPRRAATAARRTPAAGRHVLLVYKVSSKRSPCRRQ